jgi:tRNA (guanine-N7-)-methyltransferase
MTKRTNPFSVNLIDGRQLPFHRPRALLKPMNLGSEIEPGKKIEIEIGSGTGRFISERAKKFPQRYFIGIDRKKDRFDSTTEKLSRLDQNNWKILRVDAKCFLEHDLPPIEILHIYHPDPWPKRRHHKHRFFRAPDAKHWANAIVPGGELRLSTDQPDYFEEIIAILAEWKFLEMEYCAIKKSGKALSRFEEIFLSQGLPVYKAHFRRK